MFAMVCENCNVIVGYTVTGYLQCKYCLSHVHRLHWLSTQEEIDKLKENNKVLKFFMNK